MGGSISVDSTLGQGTEFTVRLRLKTWVPQPEQPAGNEAPEAAMDFTGCRILLV